MAARARWLVFVMRFVDCILKTGRGSPSSVVPGAFNFLPLPPTIPQKRINGGEFHQPP